MVSQGDPVFVLELQRQPSGDINPTPEVLIPTRASLMLESIQHHGGKPALVPKADPSVAAALAYRRRDTTVWWCLFRLMICPLLVIAAVWALLLRPQALPSHTRCDPVVEPEPVPQGGAGGDAVLSALWQQQPSKHRIESSNIAGKPAAGIARYALA